MLCKYKQQRSIGSVVIWWMKTILLGRCYHYIFRRSAFACGKAFQLWWGYTYSAYAKPSAYILHLVIVVAPPMCRRCACMYMDCRYVLINNNLRAVVAYSLH